MNGFNVYPNEVERVLDELPDVVESAAVGVPDERTGEQVVKAVLVLRPGAELTEDEVREHCAERLARFKVPRAVRVRRRAALLGDGQGPAGEPAG